MRSLDIYSDIACPWCYLGKRRLEAALARLPEDQRPALRWRAYLLQPDYPEGQSEPARALLERKFGGGPRFAAMFERLRQLGAAEGISFDLDRQVACHTGLGHRAVKVAATFGREHEATEAIFRAFFTEGRDLSDVATLVDLLAGLPGAPSAAELALALESPAHRAAVAQDLTSARRLGITGVPFFVLDGRLGLSGAQETETFLAFLREEA